MKKILHSLGEGLTQGQIEIMHQEALKLIETVGLKVPHEGIVKRLSGEKGVRVEKDRMKFDGSLVEKCLRELSYPDEKVPPRPILVSGAYEQNILDMDTAKIRQATSEDLVALTKLADSYEMFGSAPVRQMNLPSRLAEIAMYKISWENSSRRCNSILEANPKSSIEVASYVYEMSRVADKFFSIGIWITSPFSISPDDLKVLYHFIDKDVPLWIGTMPIAGATAPIHMIGAYVQSLAELFAGYTMLKLLNPQTYVYCSIIDSIRAYSFDMKYGNFVYGSPEDIWGTLVQVQLNRYYKIPIITKSLLTSSPLPDAQAAAEKAAHTILAAAFGVDGYTNAGLLAIDDIYSAEQVVIDYEIVQYAMQSLRGFDFNEETLSTKIIEEVVLKDENFLSHQSTLDYFREAFWVPELFEHLMLRQWQDKGGKSIRERAKDIAKRKIKEHEFELPAEIQRELNRIYQKAKEEFSD
ncbi:trimethylamine methyltransferase family protein [Candidatus Aerophobetes bacterium]|nr:trimethylamine methyltransferase family protein [Candidatus Aerophobetes bacterium]